MKHDLRYMKLAKEVSTWSKDPSTKIGVVVIGTKGQVLSQGFNGFPRGIEDSDERLNNREVKYEYVVHGEMNAIFNATYNGVSLDGATMYVYNLPICSECAKGIIQVGIKRVVVLEADRGVRMRWIDSSKLSTDMFKESGVELTCLHTQL
jgi:dCMP deaminase